MIEVLKQYAELKADIENNRFIGLDTKNGRRIIIEKRGEYTTLSPNLNITQNEGDVFFPSKLALIESYMEDVKDRASLKDIHFFHHNTAALLWLDGWYPYSHTFLLSQKSQDKLEAWEKALPPNHHLSFVFTANGVGIDSLARDTISGDEIILTDYERY